MEFRIDNAWLIQYGIDPEAFLEAIADYDYDVEWDNDGQAVYVFTAPDANSDGIPDFLAGLVTEPITTNPSQGGVIIG